jgi:hypothetical protein
MPSTNLWNIVNKSASGKLNNGQIISPLQKTKGSNTENLRETLQYTLDYLIPRDEETEDTDHHKRILKLIEEPMETEDDREFNTEEIRQVIKILDHKKHQEKTVSQAKLYCEPNEIFHQLII